MRMSYSNSPSRGQKIAFALLVIVIAVGLFGSPEEQPVAAQEGATPTPPALASSAMVRALTQAGARVAYHGQTGMVRFIGTDPGRPLPPPRALPASASPEDAARGFLAAYGDLFGLADQSKELIVRRVQYPDAQRTVVRFQQVSQGIPVLGGELSLHVNRAHQVLLVSGEILPDISISVTPGVGAAAARQTALEAAARWHGVPANALAASPPELWVFNPSLIRPGGGFTRLVWRVEVTPVGLLPIRELVLVDAQRGSVALHFNQIDTAQNRRTYDANNGTVLPGTLVCDESNPTCSGGDSHEVAAHTYAGHTYDFYLTTHGRDSMDNAGMAIISTVHYSDTYANAFWNGAQMVYGDADGFPLADDVVAHELTHGVTEYESNLFYYYQSGAINESLSDVWGELVDLTNGAGNDDAGVRWQMGEDVAGQGAIRNMQDPTLFNDPDKMTSPKYDTGTADNGGVHTNSGVNNKAVYLMTDGGTFNGQTVTGLGVTKVAKIYYEVQTNLLTSGSDYADLHDLVYQACLNLVGTSGIAAGDCQEVRDAANAVEMNQQPATGYNPDAPVCPAGQLPVNLFFDDLENGAGNWTFGALSGTSRWQYDSPYGRFAHSGLHFLYADDSPAAISDSYAAMNTSVTLPAGSYLHFAHAYGFEDPNYDGGVVEYSVDGGAAWNDAGGLFDFNGPDGVIDSGYSNPLAGRSAFLADSHGYLSSRLNLAPLAGQSVRFRWRMGLDSGIYDWGWWLDDVRLYTCSAASTATSTAASTATSTAMSTPTPTATSTATSMPTPTATPTTTPALTQAITYTVYLPLVTKPIRADLTISKTDGQATAEVGVVITYTIVVTNNGPDLVTGAIVSDVFLANIMGVNWTCTAAGGASCGAPGGSGDIHTTVDLPVGGAATFEASGTFNGNTTNTASIAPPAGVGDSDPSNNSASDTTIVNPLTPPPPEAGWLAYVNYYRAVAGLPPVTENAAWSYGAQQHACYMVKNDYLGHDEPGGPGAPCFSQEGVLAGANSNIVVSSDVNATDFYAIDLWMRGPFHGISIIDPALLQVGFGSFREAGTGSGPVDWKMGAVLDVIRGLASDIPSNISFPIMWPGNEATTYLRAYTGFEFPEPLTSCPGYVAPTGMPIYLQIGNGSLTPVVTSTIVTRRDGSSLEHCWFDETTYFNPDPDQQSVARAVLGARDAIVIIPRDPLAPGERYTVTVIANGQTYLWSFNVSNAAMLRPQEDLPRVEIR